MQADASVVFPSCDPRRWLLSRAVGEEFRDRRIQKLLRSVLLQDPYGGQVKALRHCRDSYNERHTMHAMLHLAPFNSRGQIWLGGLAASSNAALLEEAQISLIWPASSSKDMTRAAIFEVYPVTDGTGVMAGDLPLEPILQRVAEVAKKVLAGSGLLVCCRNGAHRSSLILLIILMFMTGRRPGQLADYMQRLRNIVDVWSSPPKRPELHALKFCDSIYDKVVKFRKTVNFPQVQPNDIMTPQQYWDMARGFGIHLPPAIPGDIAKACVEGRVIPPEEKGKGRRPGEKGKGKKDPAKGSWQPKEGASKGAGLPPPPPNAQAKIEELLEERSAAHAASQASGAAGAGAVGLDVLAERDGSKASVGKEEAAAEEPEQEKAAAEEKPAKEEPAVEEPEQDKAAKEEPAQGKAAREESGTREAAPVTKEVGSKRKDPPAEQVEEEVKKVKSDTEEVLREVFLSLKKMRRRVKEAGANLASRATSSAPGGPSSSFEEEVDYGADDEEDDEDLAQTAQAVARDEATTREVLELLFAEQQKLNQRLESLLSRQQEPEEAVADRVEKAWAALRSKDASAAGDLLADLSDATLQSMRDVAGMNPLHLVARERWYGLTYTLVGRCPSLCNEVSGQRQPPNWTPLMSLANQPKASGAAVKREYEVVQVLLPAMTTDALMTQSGTGASACHLGVSKGNLELVRQLLWELWTRNPQLPRQHLQLANSMGKSAVDVAFRNNADFARYLQDFWGGPVYTERPAWDERSYAYAWRQSSSGSGRKGKGR